MAAKDGRTSDKWRGAEHQVEQIWVKIEPPGDFFPFNSPFVVPIFDPQPYETRAVGSALTWDADMTGCAVKAAREDSSLDIAALHNLTQHLKIPKRGAWAAVLPISGRKPYKSSHSMLLVQLHSLSCVNLGTAKRAKDQG